MTPLIVFGAGGLAAQIIDTVPADTRFATDLGGGSVFGRSVERFDPAAPGKLLIAVNALDVRRRIAALWQGELAQVFADSAEASPYAEIAGGVLLCRQAVVEAGVRISEHCHVNVHACVAHGCELGPFCTVGPKANVSGDCTLGEGVYIGAGAIIREGTTIGDGAFIGMGSLVSKDIPAGARVINGRIMQGNVSPLHLITSR